ncbi:MAG TPA: acyl-CoA dehydrogenase family protein [Roseiflexaceae bacterium]|nr:acyl-CoA dehydrogenase family protein [Roseiflexaceae bacterium]
MALPYARTERQQRFVALADRLAARFAERAAIHDRDGTFPSENYADLHTEGYLRLAMPAEYGGEGANVFEMVLAQEHLARGDGATALATGMLVVIMGRQSEARDWPAPVFETICRTIAAEGGLINGVVTEPDLGSVSRGGTPSTSATPADRGWLINGHKIFVTGAPALRYFVTGVVLPPSEQAPRGETASAIVQAGSPGLRLESTWSDSLSLRTVGNDDVSYQDVFVPHEWLVGRHTIGAPTSAGQQPGMNPWSMTISAVYLGIGQAASDAACDYANNRVPPSLGKPIAELPHIQQWIGEMQSSLDAARALLYDTARTWVEQPDARPALVPKIAAAKYMCTNAACAATDKALRVAGGFGLTRSLPIERYFRDARAGLFNPPQDDIALGQVGRAALAARRPQ